MSLESAQEAYDNMNPFDDQDDGQEAERAYTEYVEAIKEQDLGVQVEVLDEMSFRMSRSQNLLGFAMFLATKEAPNYEEIGKIFVKSMQESINLLSRGY